MRKISSRERVDILLKESLRKSLHDLFNQYQSQALQFIYSFSASTYCLTSVDNSSYLIVASAQKIINVKLFNLHYLVCAGMEKKLQDAEENSTTFLKVNRFEVQENAVFIDFNRHQILKNLDNYSTLNVYHRVSLAKNLSAIKEICAGHQAYYQFLIQLAADNEQIQLELLDFLRQQHQKEPNQSNYQQQFIKPLVRLINGTHLEIKEESCALLSDISHGLSGQERKEVLRLALELEKSDDEESRIISIQLIAKMTPDMQQQEAEAFFKTDYLAMYKDSSVRIKKQIIHSSCVIAKNVTKEFLNREIIDLFFTEKCKQNVWGVRKACVQILPQLVALTDIKKQHLANLLIIFTKDGNKIVKIAAFKIIPEFIANYGLPKVPEKLIDIYLHLIDHEINHSVNRQNQIASKVAFYFPGVMQTLGASKWDVMKKLFNRLLFFKNNEIKMPIASSLHQISRIIGPELSKQYMFAALDNILKDSSDPLKLIAISHLSEFVQLFQKTTRQNLIDVFLVLQKDPKKWRVRYEIAHQLNSLSKIYETETVFKYIFPISLKLCNDNVSEVRFEAAKQMYFVIDNMKECELFQQMALESIKGYGLSQKYVQRQTFAFMVRNLYKLRIFKSKLMDMILEVAKDKIIIVRITLAISIRQIIKDDESNRTTFAQVLQIFKQDQTDVSEYFV